MTAALTPLEFFRWAVTVALLVYVVMSTLRARRIRKERDFWKRENTHRWRELDETEDEVLKIAAERNQLQERLDDALQPQRFNYDLTQAPQGTLQLLTRGGARLIGELGSVKRAQDMGIVAWATAAQRDKDAEIAAGLVPPRRQD